ncbi:AGE family epimerase/isomerase [Haliscomenobacter hydrossis]|uniref:N-acylglucosamine 2-epimerase n=1 Tax=Haliscomenobacter hydrossis (strain ATCC 27775 / DSM 1100 / LMG 10767 / O) TaxID=760192 RepID=F4L7A6_HALH1|nr:AGE family epimerase/isomerase [Haliscomenobacter hydrossis]AEE53133.1 N-acylglucosamine 2-epimerase [Haliscomenobacter hydrossis DSM 1100]
MQHFANQYRDELLENVIPFWLKNSKDEKNGGYFTCLDRQGVVFDTDKFMWLQGREVWCFSMLCDKVERRPEWLAMAQHGAAFMQKYGRDERGNWYFSTTADGSPLMQPYNIFSDCFAMMGFAALDKVAPADTYQTIVRETFENILRRRDNWKGDYNKAYPGTRPLRNFALPMILCNLSLEAEHILGTETVNSFIPTVIHEVMEVFYQPDSGLTLENVQPDGSFSDSFDGRLLNPGHVIEAMWFIMDLGHRLGDQALIQKACERMLTTLEYGWDKQYGGIFYFMDIQGHPPQQLEWDQKLWWVHVETLVGLAKAYQYTGNERCKTWFEILHEYTWKHFKDPEYPEWYGYLNRRGEVLLPLKGGKWKGCFHVPRALYQVWKTLEAKSEK